MALSRARWPIVSAVLGSLVLGVYGVIQWATLPPWDAAWIINVRELTIALGQPEAQQFRVFSTLNGPGPAATALLTCAVLASVSSFTLWLRTFAVAAAIAGLALTEVRQVYFAAVIFCVIAVVRQLFKPMAVVGMAVGLVAVVAVVPAARETAGDRVVSSAEAGSGDRSLNKRLEFQQREFSGALGRPVGLGLGSTGAGARASSNAREFSNVDSGYLEFSRTFGPFLALIMLLGLIALSAPGAWVARGPGAAAFALTLTLPIQFFLGNGLTGSTGAMTWFCLGVGTRLGIDSLVTAQQHDQFEKDAK